MAEGVTAVLDMMRGYLSLAAGLGQVSRRRAMDAARELVEGSPLAGLGNGSAENVAAQVSAVADELMAIGRQNRRLLAQLVRTETQAVLASMGTGSAPTDESTRRLDDQLSALRQRVDELERQLKAKAGETPAGRPVVRGRRTTDPASRAASSASKRATKTAAAGGSATTSSTVKRAARSASKAATTRRATTSASKAATTKAATTKAAAERSERPARRARGGAGS